MSVYLVGCAQGALAFQRRVASRHEPASVPPHYLYEGQYEGQRSARDLPSLKKSHRHTRQIEGVCDPVE
jgi:hypothetical protein